MTDISRDNPTLQQKPVHELDSAGEDEEQDTDKDDKHEVEVSDSDSSAEQAVGDLGLSQGNDDATARARHNPGLGWRPRQESQTDVPSSAPCYHGYFERQEAAMCGRSAINNGIGFCFCTSKDLMHACEDYLQEHPYDTRDMHEADTGWFSSEVMARSLLMTGDWKGRFEWGLQPLHVDPTVLQSDDVAGAVVNLRVEKHWVALRFFEEEFWLLDSLREPKLLTPLEYRFYVRRHRDAYPIYRVQKDEAMVAADTCSTGVGLDALPTLTAAGGGSASGSMAVDTPPPTQPSLTQHSPRGDSKYDSDTTNEDDDDSTMIDECVEVVRCRRRRACERQFADVEDSLIPSIAVARYISADDAQDMILAVPPTTIVLLP